MFSWPARCLLVLTVWLNACPAWAQSADADPSTWFDRMRSGLGIVLIVGLAWLVSSDRRRVDWRLVSIGLSLQIMLAVLVLSPLGQLTFGAVNDGVKGLLAFSNEGATFVFGRLADSYSLPVGGSVVPTPTPPTEAWLESARRAPVAVGPGTTSGFVEVGAWIAFNVLPTIVFFSSLMAVLYHVGIMPRIIVAIAWAMRRTLRTGGAETLSAAGNIFVGQTEAPLLIRPFLQTMTRSELMAIMTAGFATVAGGVMVAYVQMLQPMFPNIAGHLLSASLMSAPAALVLAKIMVPESEDQVTDTSASDLKSTDTNIIDAAARGAGEGLQLALNVGAMLIAFVALVALLNGALGALGGVFGLPELSLQKLLGWILAPFAYFLGVPWADAAEIGSLLGVKTVINEFVAYAQLSAISPDLTSARSGLIAVYALCGFANLGSIGIQLGGIGPLCPARRPDLAQLALRAMIAGNLAACMTGAVIGVLN
ncbi:MAG: NupC/NupG family nucleoside CNT transporter [Myxococcota bacterium]